MKKSMMWASIVGVVGAMALAGCQKHDDAAPVTPEASTTTTTTQQTAPEAPASSTTTTTTDTTTAPAATDAAGSNTALPADQTDDMSNMNSSDAAKPSTLPDSQSGTAEDNR